MSKLDDKVSKYAEDYKKKIGEGLNVDLLRKVTKGCGPVIYKADAEKVASSDKEEMERIAKNFVMKKLGVKTMEKAQEGMEKALETYGKSNRTKYRAVFYYLLVKQFRKGSLYK